MSETKAKVGFIEQRTQDGKVTPEVLQTILLDEIASRLNDVTGILESSERRLIDIHDWLTSTEMIGDSRSYDVDLSGDTPVPVQDTMDAWLECTVFSDGPSAIKISRTKTGLDQSIEYRAGDQLTLKATRGTKEPIWLQCATSSGTAGARVVFKR